MLIDLSLRDLSKDALIDLIEEFKHNIATARAEIKRLTKERDNLSKLEQSHREQANEQFHRAIKAEAERDEALARAKHMEGFDCCTCGPCAIHGTAKRDEASEREKLK